MAADSVDEEAHLDAGQRDDVVVAKSPRLGTDRRAVDLGEVAVGTLDLHEVEPVRTTRDRGDLDAGAPDLEFAFGAPQNLPLAGDWDGDGKTTIGTFDPLTREWQLRNDNSAGPADYRFVFGEPGDLPVVGVWKKP